MGSSKGIEQFAGAARERSGMITAAAAILTIAVVATAVTNGGCRRTEAETIAQASPFAATAVKSETPVSSAPTAKETAPKTGEIIVYVTGAVKRPGVYSLKGDARLYHAVRAAGGFKANAVIDALNLADRAQDGDHLCIPARTAAPQKAAKPIITHAVTPAPRGLAEIPSPRSPAFQPVEINKTVPPAVVPPLPPPVTPATEPVVSVVNEAPPAAPAPASSPGRVLGVPSTPAVTAVPPEEAAATNPAAPSTAPTATAATKSVPSTSSHESTKFKNPGDGVINLNTATAADLEKLPGVGPAMSARILEYRQQHGQFRNPKQLMDVKGIGEKKYAKMQPFVTVR